LKKLILFFLACALIFSCKKEAKPNNNNEVVTGILTYSNPAIDGQGLIYTTDKGELLLFKNEIPNNITPDTYYKNFLGLHTILTFQDTGDKGCTSGLIPCDEQTKLRIVNMIKLENQ
jgi:hypothetical protein